MILKIDWDKWSNINKNLAIITIYKWREYMIMMMMVVLFALQSGSKLWVHVLNCKMR
jgi:hypothetical protein